MSRLADVLSRCGGRPIRAETQREPRRCRFRGPLTHVNNKNNINRFEKLL